MELIVIYVWGGLVSAVALFLSQNVDTKNQTIIFLVFWPICVPALVLANLLDS